MTTPRASNLEPTAGCIARAMSVLGRKWTALILRDLISGPKRFCELERSVGKVNPRTLSQRLNDLQRQGIVSNHQTKGYYELTDKGRDLLPILKQMANWGTRYPA